MTTTPSPSDQPGPPERLVREWIACGLVTASAQFVPIPLLDDAIAGRASRIAIARTLRHHSRSYDVDDVEPLFAGADGWLPGVAKYVTAIPGKLLMFPLRKYKVVIGAARGVPDDVAKVVALGHVTDVRLAAGGLSGTTAKERRQEAQRLRKAFDKAYDQLDWAVWRVAVGESLAGVAGLPTAAARYTRTLLTRRPADDETAPPEQGEELTAAVDDVRGVLRRPEIARLVADLDARIAALDPYPR